jgi:hypothetical protein
MVDRDPGKRVQEYSELIDKLEELKRSSLTSGTSVATPPSAEHPATTRMNLYETSFAEILGNIWRDRYTGRLTLRWLDLSKIIHFKEGIITAVLSNQEGERFIDLLLSERRLRPDAAWKIQTARSDLFTKYSSAMDLVGQEGRDNLRVEFQGLAWKILENLFSWGAGEFILEPGSFPDQPGIDLPTSDVIAQGIRHHLDFSVIFRKLSNGKIKLTMTKQCTSRLRQVRLTASERFLLIKTEAGISYHELHSLSNLPHEHFARIIYVFLTLGLIEIEDLTTCAVTVEPDHAGKWERQYAMRTPVPPHAAESSHYELKQTTATEAQPSHLASEYGRKAAEDYGNGNYWSAVQLCKKALEYKEDYRIFHLMGKALSKHQGFKFEAMKALKNALDLNPSNAAIQKDIADLYLLSGDIALAEAHYKKILSAHPRDKHCAEKLREIHHRNDFTKVVGRTIGKLFSARKSHVPA